MVGHLSRRYNTLICPHCKCSEWVYEVKSTVVGFRRFHCKNPTTVKNHHKEGNCSYWYISTELLIDGKFEYRHPYKNSMYERYI